MHFQKIIKQNLALMIGIMLPILMVLFFVMAQTINKVSVPPPQQDFMIGVYDYNTAHTRDYITKIFVENEKLKINASKPDIKNDYLKNRHTRLYRYVAKDNLFQEIVYAQPKKTGEFLITETERIKLNPAEQSQDGFVFNMRHDYHDGGIILDFFWWQVFLL